MNKASWHLSDAQKLSEQNPYTFDRPSPDVLSKLKVGDFVKLIFEIKDTSSEAPGAERMWVLITSVTHDGYLGKLRNVPNWIKDLKLDDTIQFQVRHIANTELEDPIPSIVEKYLPHSFVTNNILYEGQNVGYMYRETPEDENDSGWRFSTGYETDEYMGNADNISYVSLGAVLSQDDSVLDYLDLPVGSAFIKNVHGNFVLSE